MSGHDNKAMEHSVVLAHYQKHQAVEKERVEESNRPGHLVGQDDATLKYNE